MSRWKVHPDINLYFVTTTIVEWQYVFSTDDGKNLSDIMRDFGRHTSHEIIAQLHMENQRTLLGMLRRAAVEEGLGHEHKVWQGGFHPIAITSAGFLWQKMEYMHNNPVRRAFVERPEHWKYSSARNYLLDDHSIIEVECLT